MSKISLWTNTNELSVPVKFSNEKVTTIYINPNEAFFDENGLVRILSIKFNDGKVGNFKLLPNNQTSDSAMRFIINHLGTVGLTIVAGEIIEENENTVIDNVARYLFEKAGGTMIENIFEQYSVANSSYYEVTTGEQVFIEPIYV